MQNCHVIYFSFYMQLHHLFGIKAYFYVANNVACQFSCLSLLPVARGTCEPLDF